MIDRNVILTAARDLMIRHGVRNTGLDELTKSLGISKKTIYTHFTDKASLLNEVIQLNIDRLTESIRNAEESSANAISEFISVTSDIIDSNITWQSTSLQDLQAYCYPAYEQCMKFKQHILEDFLYKNFSRGIKEEFYSGNWDSRLLVENALFMMDNCCAVIGKRNQHFSALSVKNYFVSHFLFGLCGPSGRAMVERQLSAITLEN
ncbi:MAG: TetR/AcrR family transcriptional regulator [Chitinophagaceae bacterium]